MKIGNDTNPINRSETAMFITKIRLLLRSFLLNANSTIVKRFPATMKKLAIIKTLENAMPAALESWYEIVGLDPAIPVVLFILRLVKRG